MAWAGVLIGHDVVQLYTLPSGWRLHCECGEQFRGVRENWVLDRWNDHRDEVAADRGLCAP